jgi:putative sterol carrier protein
MAVKFLSEEWARAMTTTLNASDEFKNVAQGHQLKLQQIIQDAPEGGEKRYYFRLEDGNAEIGIGEIADPEATLTQNYETAAAINRQELNAQNAFMQGKLRISGNMMKLMQLQSVFSLMPRVVADIDVVY